MSGSRAANNVGVRAATAPLIAAAQQRHDRAGRRDRRARRAPAARPAPRPRGRGWSTATAGRRSRSDRCCRRWTELAQRVRVARWPPSDAAIGARLRRATSSSRERDVDWVSGRLPARAARRGASPPGCFDERYLPVRGGRRLLRRAARARAAGSCSRPRADVVHLRGRSVRAAGAAGRRATTTAATSRSTRSTRPRWAPVAAPGWLATAARDRAVTDRDASTARPPRCASPSTPASCTTTASAPTSAIWSRSWRGMDGDDDVRAALPRRRTPRSCARSGPRFEAARRARRQLLASASRSACRSRCGRARRRSVPRAALRRARR